MATVVARPTLIRQSHTPPPLTGLNESTLHHLAVPNKFLPPVSPGRPPTRAPDTPPASPPTKHLNIHASSILHPPDSASLLFDSPAVYSVDTTQLAAALDHLASQALPDPKQVFPWLHGLHPENNVQLGFFVARRRSLRRTPKCLRGITIVKAGGDLSASRITGAIGPEELLALDQDSDVSFLEADPKEGFSVRNFQIQTRKMALISDIVVYGDDGTDPAQIHALAKQFAGAQRRWHSANDLEGRDGPLFHTFVLTSSFADFERVCPELIAVDAKGQMTGQVTDFFYSERAEMCAMSRASEIATNVWLGPTPASMLGGVEGGAVDGPEFDVMIEASDLAPMPNSEFLHDISTIASMADEPQLVEFPSSGGIVPPTWTMAEIDGLVDMCQWIYRMANAVDDDPFEDPAPDTDGDVRIRGTGTPCKILIHCADGYTESSLLALAYFMYVEACPVHEAWLRLHDEKQRNFFAYPSDLSVLKMLQPRLLRESPRQRDITIVSEPAWLSRMDGSFPSRIVPYMYLGNLGHANNPGLLRALGIGRILSVGEPLSWSPAEEAMWNPDKLLYIDQVQDNGVDPLTDEFARCLDFIHQGRREGGATLVHCRVGVSRSATICIAEVMSSLGMSFSRAYCFVRARRLNVIIQPHLRFSYELLKWDELLQARRGQPLKRELEWASIAREITLMNRPYAR
ncbi:MAG: tyrosine/serine/threonine protein phosphatase pps1 [Thelocarpon superellum]|nr:MAG: tyrosine/serine/threonine protein phosphatase pps1 [Thelocarpon superellum]